MSRFIELIKISALLLAIVLVVGGCSPSNGGEEPSEGERLAQEMVQDSGEVDIEAAIAQTVEAQTAVEAMVQLTVAAQLEVAEAENPAQEPTQNPETDPPQDPIPATVDLNAPDVADPDSGIEAIKSVADPNVESGTPQLKVIYASINVRLGPGPNCRPTSALLKDSIVPAKSVNQDGNWFEIILPNGETGWVADSVTDFVVAADRARVPVSSTPYCAPPPTATATSTTVPTNTPLPTHTTTAPLNTPLPTHTSVAPGNTHTPTSTTTAPMHTATSTTAAPVDTPTSTATATEMPVIISSNIEARNNTAVEIWYLFIDLSSDGFGNDRLGNNVIMPGDSFVVNNLPAGTYDFIAFDEFDDIVAEQYGVPVSGYQQWDIR